MSDVKVYCVHVHFDKVQIRTQGKGCCELVLELIMPLKGDFKTRHKFPFEQKHYLISLTNKHEDGQKKGKKGRVG